MKPHQNGTFNSDDKLVFEMEVFEPHQNYSNMQFSWNIEYQNDNNEIIVENLLDESIYDFVTQYLNILVIDVSKDDNSVLVPNISYTVVGTAKIDSSRYNCDSPLFEIYCNETSTQSTTIIMNEPPARGNCTFFISNETRNENGLIYALETLVTVSCQDWWDQHLPLTYAFDLNDGMCLSYL